MIIAYIRDDCDVKETANNKLSIKSTESNETVIKKRTFDFHTHSPSNLSNVGMHRLKSMRVKRMLIDDIIQCFSLRKNFQILISVHKPVNAVPIVDGLKYVIVIYIQN